MNIVTESRKHERPNSLNDCLKADGITDNLWTWSERLERFGKILFWIIVIFGIIIAVSTANIVTEVEKGYGYYTYTKTETEFSVEVFFSSVVKTALYAFIEYCAYHALSLLIGALASITHNTKITARITEYVARKTLSEQESKIHYNDKPQKPVAKRVVQEKAKPILDDMEMEYIKDEQLLTSENLADDEKPCPNCGTVQKISRTVCWACGQKFDN